MSSSLNSTTIVEVSSADAHSPISKHDSVSSAKTSGSAPLIDVDDRRSSISTSHFEDDEDFDNLVAVDDRIQQFPSGSNPHHDHYGQHPALETMCVMDCQQRIRIVPNGPSPVDVSALMNMLCYSFEHTTKTWIRIRRI